MHVTKLEDKDLMPLKTPDRKTVTPRAAFTFFDENTQKEGKFHEFGAEDFHPIFQMAKESQGVLGHGIAERTVDNFKKMTCYANASLTGGCAIKKNQFGRKEVVSACNVPKDWPGERVDNFPMVHAVCEMSGTVVGECLEPLRKPYEKAGFHMVASLPFEKRCPKDWPAKALEKQGYDPFPMIYAMIRPLGGQLHSDPPEIIHCQDEQSFYRQGEQAFQQIIRQEKAVRGAQELKLAQELPKDVGQAWTHFCDPKNFSHEIQIQALKGNIPGLPEGIPEKLQKSALYRLEHPRSRESSPSVTL